jgi:hypothetical protein
METMAKHWEDQFDDVMRDGRKGQFRPRLEWFLFKLNRAVRTVEIQSDGSKLLIFSDGSVYGEESQLDRLLTLASRLGCRPVDISLSAAGFANGRKRYKAMVISGLEGENL